MKSNILYILTDDQGPWAMGCAGNDEIRTPNLDRLAASGMRFRNFFCTSPVCSPARASIMTGRLPSQHGVHDWIRDRYDGKQGWWLDPARYDKRPVEFLAGQTCTTDILSEAGYTCALSGKWHLGDSLTPQHGFSHWYCHPKGGSQYNDMEMIDQGTVVKTNGYLSDVITDNALSFLDGHAASHKDEPFYLSVHYTAPHSPWVNQHPQDIVDSYDDCPFKTCPQEAMHPWARGLTKGNMGNREALKGYFAAVTAMDRNVGRLLDKLAALGLTNDTLVVFMSDNGFSCGHHGFWGKGNGTGPLNMYENSVKVPGIFSHPGRIASGVVSDAMVSQYDVLPTLLAHVGLDAPDDETLPGTSFEPVLAGARNEAREDVVVYDEYGPVRMIRTREWKYVHRFPAGPHELYDLKNDPGERKNLVDDKERRPLVDEMLSRMASWFERYVNPHRDGARFPVSGGGQFERIDDAHCGEGAFSPRDY